jgi:hypothetical protein
VVSAESNDDRTELERDANGSVNERMRALGRRSGEARRRRKAEQEQAAGELTDRERALAALRRSLNSGNAAAVVAAGKALIDLERSDPRAYDSDALVQGARDQLADNLMAMAARRQAASERGDTRRPEVCSACGQSTDLDSVMGVVSALTMVSAGAGHARPAPELAAEIEARRAERREQEPVSPPGVSAPSQPFQDPAFVQALEERRSLGLGPVRWDDED